jgi:hypothetical protein
MENKSSDQANDAQSRTTSKSIVELVKSIFSTKELRTVDDYIVQQDRFKFVNLVSLCTALGLLMGATNGYREVKSMLLNIFWIYFVILHLIS